MEDKRKKKIITGFFIFLGLMWLCTVISKSIYASQLPVVSTERVEQKYVEHIVNADGIVVAGDKNPVTSLSGIRVDKLMVQEGDRVEEGDVLFTVDMEDLGEIMSAKQVEISKLQVQIDTILENRELERQKKELEEERAREDYDAQARYEDTLVGRAAEEYNKIENEIADRIEEGAGEGQIDESLFDALQQAAYAEADAKWKRDNAIKDAGRKVEDITSPDSEDSVLEVNRLELSNLQTDLQKYEEIRNAEGQVRALQGGLITDVYIRTGGRISDSTIMLMADDSVPCQFKMVLTGEQKKYVGLNDKVALKLDGSSKDKDVTIDYLSESDTMPGSYEAYINLPEGVGVPGLSGTMSHSESGEKYSCCVTPSAIHTDNARKFVYVVKEREGILGMEYYVEQITVTVKDENENWVAVEGALDGDSKIISVSSKEIRNGEVVRLSQE